MSARIVSLNRKSNGELRGMVIVMVNKTNKNLFLEITEELDENGDIVVMYRPSSNRVWTKSHEFTDLPDAVTYWTKREYRVKWTVLE